MFKNFKKKNALTKHLKENNFYSEFISVELEKNFNFVMISLPDEYSKNLVFLEDVIEFELTGFNLIRLHKKDNPYSIKKKIGLFFFKKGELSKFETIARDLLTSEKIKLSFLHSSYKTVNPVEIFEELTTDVFAFFNSVENLKIDEVAETINSIYINNYVNNSLTRQSSIDPLFD